jgi:hypothetical protein
MAHGAGPRRGLRFARAGAVIDGVAGTAWRWLAAELARVFGPVAGALRRREWHRFWLGPAATLIVAGLALAYRTRQGHVFIDEYAITRPGDGWADVALALPLSMFAPAAMLPFWFAMLQVGVVYSVGQVLLGWWRTVLVAAAGHALATCSAHLWVMAGPPLGVGHRYDRFGDAGPSVAVVTVIAYFAVHRGAHWLAGLLIGYDVVEISIFNGLSQREHLLGVVFGVAAASTARLIARRGRGHGPPVPRPRPAPADPSARPARRSRASGRRGRGTGRAAPARARR